LDPAGSIAFARDYGRQGLGGCEERRGEGKKMQKLLELN